jgi:hypothetical protein
MIETQYSEIGVAIGVSCARQEELFEKLVDYETKRDAITNDAPSSTLVQDEDPVIRTVSILQWILTEPSFSMEDRVFLAHRIGVMVTLPDDEDDFEDEELTSEEEDRELREIVFSFLRSDIGRDMFRSLPTELEMEESEEDEIEDN